MLVDESAVLITITYSPPAWPVPVPEIWRHQTLRLGVVCIGDLRWPRPLERFYPKYAEVAIKSRRCPHRISSRVSWAAQSLVMAYGEPKSWACGGRGVRVQGWTLFVPARAWGRGGEGATGPSPGSGWLLLVSARCGGARDQVPDPLSLAQG